MYDRRRAIRNRIRKRKKMQENQNRLSSYERERSYSSNVTTYDSGDEGNHPLFRKDLFLLKVLVSALLFFSIAALYKYPSEKLQVAKDFVASTFEKEMQFAAVTDWYEDTFGKPIAFLPSDQGKESKNVETVSSQYSEPVNGQIVQNFKENGEGVLLETALNLKVGAIQNGVVTFVGMKENTGNTVVVQHSDGSESWYGELESISVSYMDSVSKGEKLGMVSSSHDASKGRMFFAFKKKDAFVDPNQVISFE
ncbi:M23 family metallopeptidase [Bacillus massiliigorillae]|uniref:M23 family metallopeptidase n=1 Tax=Bacillus massiliigorillae TaxID=1243664 RepID=UPI0003A421C6|nr:M23 family metallopeptidase [Bacillus massiliigorillae]